MSATRPTSPAKLRTRSRAGSCRLATSPEILEETNSLWMVNSPMPEKTPGKVLRTRRMWSAAYMSLGLKPVIMGSKRACCCLVRDLYDMEEGVGEGVVVER